MFLPERLSYKHYFHNIFLRHVLVYNLEIVMLSWELESEFRSHSKSFRIWMKFQMSQFYDSRRSAKLLLSVPLSLLLCSLYVLEITVNDFKLCSPLSSNWPQNVSQKPGECCPSKFFNCVRYPLKPPQTTNTGIQGLILISHPKISHHWQCNTLYNAYWSTVHVLYVQEWSSNHHSPDAATNTKLSNFLIETV